LADVRPDQASRDVILDGAIPVIDDID